MIARFSLLALMLLSLCGCYHTGPDDDLRAVPVTNNPNVVPNHGVEGRWQFSALRP